MRTNKEIQDIKAYLEYDYYAKLHKQFGLQSDWYNQTMSLGTMRPGVTKYTPPTARAIVDSTVDYLMGLGHTAHIPLWSNDQADAAVKERLERFAYAFLQWIEKTYRINIRRTCIKNCMLHGMMVQKGPLYLSSSRLKPERETGEREPDYKVRVDVWEKSLDRTFPFSFRDVSPKNIFLDPSDPPGYVIERYTRTVSSIKAAWPEWVNTSDLPDFTTREWWEFWSPEQRQFFIANGAGRRVDGSTAVLSEDVDKATGFAPIENIHGFIPYEVGYAGFGLNSPEGKPEHVIAGILDPILSALKIEARLKTTLVHGIMKQVFGKPTLDMKPGDDFKDTEEPGDYSIIPTIYNYRNEAPPAASTDAYRMLSMVGDDAQQAVPRPFQGQGGRGITSGYQEAIRIGQFRPKLEGTKSAWESLVSRSLDKVLHLVKYVVKEPIGLLGNFPEGKAVVTIKPSEIKPDLQRYYIELDAESPEQKERRMRLGAELWAMGSITAKRRDEDFYDYPHLEESKQMLIERALAHPNIQAAITQEAMTDAGMKLLLDDIVDGKFSSAPQHGFGTQERTKMMLEPGTNTLGTKPEQEGAPNEEITNLT